MLALWCERTSGGASSTGGCCVRTIDRSRADRSRRRPPAVAKAAAGALEHVAIARIGNVSQALEDLKKRGFWIYGLDERGEQLYSQVDYARPTVFVLGGEGHGLHQQVRKHCDIAVRIPMAGAISSLNVSVAAGVVLFEWRRRGKLTG